MNLQNAAKFSFLKSWHGAIEVAHAGTKCYLAFVWVKALWFNWYNVTKTKFKLRICFCQIEVFLCNFIFSSVGIVRNKFVAINWSTLPSVLLFLPTMDFGEEVNQRSSLASIIMSNGSIYMIANGWVYMMPQSISGDVWQQHIMTVIITIN